MGTHKANRFGITSGKYFLSNSLTYEVNGPVALLTLNRPDKLNAIDTTMMAEMNAAMDQAEEDHSIRAIVVKANGKSFSAGFDLDDEVWSSDKDEDIRAALQNDFDTIMRFWDSPKPTIACVQGYCLGGAMELALSCDLTVASSCALFGEPEVSIASGIVVLNLPWLTGPKLAKEILLCADKRIPAQRIYEMGLLNRVVDLEELESTGIEFAETIAANDMMSVAITKKAINKTMEISGMRSALDDASEANMLLETTDYDEKTEFYDILKKEGIKAALEWRRSLVFGKGD